MRIAFDGTTLRPGRTGVGYYSEHLLRHLVSERVDDEVIVLSNRPIDTTSPLPSRVRLSTSSIRVPRMVWMQVSAPRLLEELRPDVVHFTNGMVPMMSRVPTVVTIHDMSLTLYPKYHPPRRVLLNRPFVDLAARRADAIITVSESAKRDIVRLLGIPPPKVRVVYLAPDASVQRAVPPAEIEAVVQEVPGIAACQVIAVPRASGPVPVAFVLVQDGASLDEAMVIAHASNKLARYKVPVRIVAIDAFPVTPGANATKIQKGKLREMAEALLH